MGAAEAMPTVTDHPSSIWLAAGNAASGMTPYGELIPVAWLGRVSTDDQQDPTLSLPRQLASSRAALPPNMVIVAHFWDIESGRKDLELRGHGTAHEKFNIPIPRDGGIADLIAESTDKKRRFEAVICENIERVARRTYYSTKIEHDLERAGVELLAADEGVARNGKRATMILARRVKQGVAEWYVRQMLELAWDGYCEHTRQGWNIGKPAYGYLAEKVEHPVPARRAEGKTKSRLLPDPLRAPVVHQIFMWRAVERLGYRVIADRLNSKPSEYPPPVPVDPTRACGYWTGSNVREILHNPKYLGYMVWNRRGQSSKGRGKLNPPTEWVWSPMPTHEPLVTGELFTAASAVAAERKGSRNASGLNRHPATRRSYRLRSFVTCDECGRRMLGKTRDKYVYLTCEPKKNHRKGAAERFEGHPVSVFVREDALLTGVLGFLNEHVFGARRVELYNQRLAAAIQAVDPKQDRKRLDTLRRSLADLEARQRRLITTLEEHDADGTMFTHVRDRLAELTSQRKATLDEIATVEKRASASPTQAATELLDALPLDLDLNEVPDEILRPVLEALQLRVNYDGRTNRARCHAVLRADAAPTINRELRRHGRRTGRSTSPRASANHRTFPLLVARSEGLEPPTF